jgi:exonuclease SbcD
MKFLHLADLHLGKSIHGVSLLESGDQPVWIQRFLEMARDIRPDAVVIAGDVYDRSAPSGDAVALLDRMVTGLAELGIPVLIVPGNHDSGQRMSFAGRSLMVSLFPTFHSARSPPFLSMNIFSGPR